MLFQEVSKYLRGRLFVVPMVITLNGGRLIFFRSFLPILLKLHLNALHRHQSILIMASM